MAPLIRRIVKWANEGRAATLRCGARFGRRPKLTERQQREGRRRLAVPDWGAMITYRFLRWDHFRLLGVTGRSRCRARTRTFDPIRTQPVPEASATTLTQAHGNQGAREGSIRPSRVILQAACPRATRQTGWPVTRHEALGRPLAKQPQPETPSEKYESGRMSLDRRDLLLGGSALLAAPVLWDHCERMSGVGTYSPCRADR